MCALLGPLVGPAVVIFVFVDSGNDGLATLEAAAGCVLVHVITIGAWLGLVAATGGL